jgi:hypothetical protein
MHAQNKKKKKKKSEEEKKSFANKIFCFVRHAWITSMKRKSR